MARPYLLLAGEMRIESLPHLKAPILSTGVDPRIVQLKEGWDDWWDNPNRQTGGALLQFLKEHQSYLKEVGRKKCQHLLPFYSFNFDQYYDRTLEHLANWINEGCDPELRTVSGKWLKETYNGLNQWI
jgi:hypothetical protein